MKHPASRRLLQAACVSPVHESGALDDFVWPSTVCGNGSLVQTGQLARGHFHDTFATAAIKDIHTTAGNYLLRAIEVLRLLYICVIEFLVDGGGGLQHVVQGVCRTLHNCNCAALMGTYLIG